MHQDSLKYRILDTIDDPKDLRKIDPKELPALADELRQYLIKVTAKTGGHLAPGLGTVELAIALHYVFDTPNDCVVWDIGHQAYPHKILTNRKKEMYTLRKKDGLSGFLNRTESIYDTFGAGHAGTSISAALGMATSIKLQQDSRDVIAVIGDGALTSGLAFEALNNAGASNVNLLVILNDNEMSISPNVGAISNYLARILSGKAYTWIRDGSRSVLSTFSPSIKNMARRWEEHLKGMIMPSTLFEEFGFYYIGPIDGHNLPHLTTTMQNLKRIKGLRFLHISTKKGKGYKPAEGNPCDYHGVTPFNMDTGKMETKPPAKKTYTQVFGEWLCEMASLDEKLVGITPAMKEGSGLVEFSKHYPDRYFDVGIAEQHALTFAAGLACTGYKPVVAIYSTFLQRAYDQLVHDIAIQNLDVLLAVDRSGLVGADGATHQGVFDYSYARSIPNMVIMSPSNENECRQMLYTGYLYPGPAIVRYPKSEGIGLEKQDMMTKIEIGTSKLIRSSKKNIVAILCFGPVLHQAVELGDDLDATIIDMRFVKPLDKSAVLSIARTHRLIVTIEEHVIMGGAGSAINELLAKNCTYTPTLNLGIPDVHIDHASRKEQLLLCGINAESIRRDIINTLKNKNI